MNGPEHYRMAERLLRSCQLPPILDHPDDAPTYPASEWDESTDREVNTIGNALVAAQVHATLALAAATAAIHMDEFVELEDTALAWARVTAP